MWLKRPPDDILESKRQRLENLYYVVDKDGYEVPFKLNWMQSELDENRWYQMLILKSRQLGCTTFWAIDFLDDCFWQTNLSAGIIAHRKEDAENIFKKKVKYAYDRMPAWTREINQATNDRAGELAFRNGSSYRVSTGFRSGTNQRLLISEFGKICASSPDVAREIVTGSLNTVGRDQIVVIESTAEGREGYFYDFSKQSEALKISGAKISPMQMRFFFFPWYEEPSYRESSLEVIVSKETNEYLDIIELERQRKIDEEQRRWYEMKLKMLGDAMKQEYPSNAREAFESANEGLYYGAQITKLRAGGAITRVPYDNSQPVHCAFDIGLDDFTSIWCFQLMRGGAINIINFYENYDEEIAHYADWLTKTKYKIGRIILPHDAAKRENSNKLSYADHLRALLDGNGKIVIIDRRDSNPFDGIQAVRAILSRCSFDEQHTSKGIKHLESYRKLWDDRLGCYKNTPFHDEHSHCADSFRYLAIGLQNIESTSRGSVENDHKAVDRYYS